MKYPLSPQIDVDLSGLEFREQLEVAAELNRYLQAEALQMEVEQIQAAHENHNSTLRSIDGIGGQILAIHPTAFLYYKTVEQLDFSSRKDIRWLQQRYPETKVRSGGTKLQVGWTPSQKDLVEVQRGGVRERKSYP